MSTKKGSFLNNFLGGVLFLAMLGIWSLAYPWLDIPDKLIETNWFHISSLTFINGISSGWADDIAAHYFFSDSHQATQAFKHAILIGEAQYSTEIAICNVLGAFLSIGGVIAVFLARLATTSGNAFIIAFLAEIAEGIVFHIGYYTTVGEISLSGFEVVITLVVAVIMGCIAMAVHGKYKKATQ